MSLNPANCLLDRFHDLRSNVIVYASPALRGSSTCLLFASQPICNRFQNEDVLQFKRRTKPRRFENASRFIKFAKPPGQKRKKKTILEK